MSGNVKYSVADAEEGRASELIQVSRRVSNSAFTNASGESESITVSERRNSSSYIAVTSRLSNSAIPTIFDKPADPKASADGKKKATESAKGTYVEHLWNLQMLQERCFTSINTKDLANSGGLTEEKAKELLKLHGPNVLTPPPRVPLWLLFLLQFTNYFMILLMIAGLACFIIYAVEPSNPFNMYLGILLFFVVIMTCYQTFSEEAKSDNLMAKFRNLVPENASVIRGGVMLPVGATQIVPGDLIRLKSGDKVPADCRILFNQSMKVDQSMITGESEPVDVGEVAADQNPFEARNIIFNGSLVVDGGALAIAIRTGIPVANV